MKKMFMCSLCHNGILGGALYLEEKSVTYRTNKLTVDEAYRNLVLPIDEIAKLTWKRFVFPIATFHIKNGKSYKFIIFNKRRFESIFKSIVHNKE